MNIKLVNGILTGKELPAHIGKAYGRYIFRLCHTLKQPKSKTIWLRDLPLNLCDLEFDYGFSEPIKAYYAECFRTGEKPLFDLP